MKDDDQIKGFDWDIFRKLFQFLRPYRGAVIFALICLVIAAAAELSIPWLLQKTIDGPLLKTGNLEELWHNGFIILSLLLGGMLGGFGMTYFLAWASQMVMKDIRVSLFKHFLSQKAAWLAKNPVGRLVSGVTSDVAAVTEFFNTLFTSLLKDFLTMIGVVVTLLLLDPTLGLWTVVSLPPALILIAFFRIFSRKAFRRVRAAIGKVNTFLSEHLGGISILQIFGRETSSAKEFSNENIALLKANLGEMWVNAVFRPLIDVLNSITLGFILWFGLGLYESGLVSLGVMIAFINLTGKFYQPISSIAENFSALQSAMAGGERIFNFLADKSSLETSGSFVPNDHSLKSLEFRDVHFSYNQNEPVLQGLNMTLVAGQTTALVGYTGAGKTTVTSLLTGLWEPVSGSILLNGKDIRDYNQNWVRNKIQSVLQDVFLFSGTVYENIDLGRGLGRERIQEVCRWVQADDFITQMPEGYDSKLNEGATNLSAGQRQLLSFARVLAQDPQLVILDEATAHIDSETELLIQKAMTRLFQDRTALVIAHRLSTIRHAHKIIVLDQGIAVEEGTHDQLLDLKGFYYNLYKLQYEKQPEI